MSEQSQSPRHPAVVLTIRTAVEQYALSRASLYRIMASGDLESLKVGRRHLIRRDDIEAFLAGRRSRGTRS
jgi:excisionase family DNA binding protein